MKPTLIGIAGASGSGKSELARALAARLPGSAIDFTLDHYYHALDHLTYEERCAVNFDSPDSLDADLLVTQLRQLASGQEIARPSYSFATHSRLPADEWVAPADFVLVEGLFALYWHELRDLLDVKIYVDTVDEVCFDRRLKRDVGERHRSEESIRSQYAATVRPMAFAYVRPTREHADLIVSGEQPIHVSVQQVLAMLPGRAMTA